MELTTAQFRRILRLAMQDDKTADRTRTLTSQDRNDIRDILRWLVLPRLHAIEQRLDDAKKAIRK